LLTTTAYITACVIYVVAALVATVVMYRFWLITLPASVARVLAGLLTGLLVVPAQPSAGSETLAPALVVAIFNALFGDGWPTARQAVVLLGVAGSLGALLGGLAVLLPSKRAPTTHNMTDVDPAQAE